MLVKGYNRVSYILLLVKRQKLGYYKIFRRYIPYLVPIVEVDY